MHSPAARAVLVEAANKATIETIMNKDGLDVGPRCVKYVLPWDRVADPQTYIHDAEHRRAFGLQYVANLTYPSDLHQAYQGKGGPSCLSDRHRVVAADARQLEASRHVAGGRTRTCPGTSLPREALLDAL